MVKKQGYTFETSKGWMGVLASEQGIALVTQPFSSGDEARKELSDTSSDEVVFGGLGKDSLPARFGAKVAAYFQGKNVTFDEPVDLRSVPDFHRRVLEFVRTIPRGEVRTYGEVARELGNPKAARAVGQAMHRNPVPIIIPCHRVVASNGSLRGFGWGLELKEWLIGMERKA